MNHTINEEVETVQNDTGQDGSYAIPFGRASRDKRRTESGADFVGRDGERAFLTEALTSGGPRGAYLITGRRGVGKSSFVETCIEEYEASVFKRFLRSEHGRSFFDLVLLIFFVSLVLVAMLVASDFLEQIAAPRQDNGFLTLIALPLIALALVPMGYAHLIMKTAMKTLDVKMPWVWASNLLGAWVIGGVLIGPVGAPALSLSRLGVAVAVIIVLGVSLRIFTDSPPRNRLWRMVSVIAAVAILCLVMVGSDFAKWASIPLDAVMPLQVDTEKLKDPTLYDVANNILIISWLFSVTMFRLGRMAGSLPAKGERRGSLWKRINLVRDRAKAFGGIIVALSMFWMLIAAVEGEHVTVNVWAFLGWVVFIVMIVRFPKPFAKPPADHPVYRFAPPIAALLVIKALFFATLSLHLVYPGANLIPKTVASFGVTLDEWGVEVRKTLMIPLQAPAESGELQAADDGGTWVSLASSRPYFVCAEETGKWNESKGRNCPDHKKRAAQHAQATQDSQDILEEQTAQTDPYLTLFSARHEETVWLFAALIVLFMIFLMEFDWINRSMIAERQSSALGLSPRFPARNRAHSHFDPIWIKQAHDHGGPHTKSAKDENDWRSKYLTLPPLTHDGHTRRVSLMREVERATLPWLIIKVWMPSIIVRVNLGFDTLDHRGVTHAMLFGLRNEYQKKFLNLFSAYSILVNFVVLMFLLQSVSYLGETAFDFPDTRFINKSIAKKDRRETFVVFKQDPPKECSFQARKEAREDEWYYRRQGCAIYDDKKDSQIESGLEWSDFFESVSVLISPLLPPVTNLTQNIDYCVVLAERLAGSPSSHFLYSTRSPDSEDFSYGPIFGSSAVPRMLCNAAPETANVLLPILFAEVLPVPVSTEIVAKQREAPSHFAFSFLHDNNGLPVYTENSIRTYPSLSVRVYHILTFILLLSLWRTLSQRFSIHPYRTTVARIDALIQSLDSRSTQQRRFSVFQPISMISRLFVDEKTEEFQREKLDPRSVELALLNVLEDVRHTETGILRGAVTLPVPELTFIFDELDKISGVFGAGANSSSSIAADQTALDAERRRAYALHQLMSDMKRVISSAPARFIFVGNRLLHDEWTADRSRRQPLLTSIFDTEIYLPSLMLDSQGTLGAGRPQERLSHRSKEYLVQRHRRALDDYDRFVEDRISTFPTLHTHPPAATAYLQDPPIPGMSVTRPIDDIMMFKDIELLLMSRNSGMRTTIDTTQAGQGTQFIRAFTHFLTFRSGGNPKKLQELLNEFIRPAARLSSPDDAGRWTMTKGEANEPLLCEDVLLFRDRSIYRIQLIDALYMHLVERFETELLDRDDKVSEAILYLFDFLMKFHGRAFSWSSLERVEELVHIHRTPDLRAILTRIVEDASERWLHRLLNGMYDFRFRSDFAVELRYLSRLHQPEAAALNFTLDEAQGLKATYIATLQEAEGHGSRRDEEAIAGLGELHEYDQEYAEARARYQEAIDESDLRFSRMAGETVAIHDPIQAAAESAAMIEPQYAPQRPGATALGTERHSPAQVPFIHAIMAQDRVGMRVPGVFIPWGIRRLRLMLQVAMTYELARDFEPAKLHYLNARLFAWALIETYPAKPSEKLKGFEQRMEMNRIEAANDIAKHINLLYQPIFAEAWISEKLENGVDTACSLVESDLLRLRRRLPFLRDLTITKDGLTKFVNSDGTTNAASGAADANMALVGAELHNKAGDLYFYKGRRATPYDQLKKSLDMEAHRSEIAYEFKLEGKHKGDDVNVRELASDDGLLLRAHYHYAVGLHELRRFVAYRRLTSGAKMNPIRGRNDEAFPWLTIPEGSWPTFVPQSIHNNLSDMAEATLARTSFLSLLVEMDKPLIREGTLERAFYENLKNVDVDESIENLVHWFESTDTEIEKDIDAWKKNGEKTLSRTLYQTFGTWAGDRVDLDTEPYPHLVAFASVETTLERIVVGFSLSLASAEFAKKAGYPEDAAREHLLILELCGRYLKWLDIASVLIKKPSNAIEEVWKPADRNLKVMSQFKLYLGKIAVRAANEYDILTWRAWRRRPYPEKCAVGQHINPEAVTLLCSIARAMEGTHSKALLKVSKALLETVVRWFGDCAPAIDGDPDPLVLLRHSKHLFRYPALNQLLALKSMIDAICLDVLKSDATASDRAMKGLYDQLDTLRELYERFGAPLHFTPAMLGESAALIVLTAMHGHDDLKEVVQDERFSRVVRRALERLTASRETYSMGRAYYSAIADLYYLYDDYNDRRIHANHAAQMAGSEMHSVLIKEMEKAEELWRGLNRGGRRISDQVIEWIVLREGRSRDGQANAIYG